MRRSPLPINKQNYIKLPQLSKQNSLKNLPKDNSIEKSLGGNVRLERSVSYGGKMISKRGLSVNQKQRVVGNGRTVSQSDDITQTILDLKLHQKRSPQKLKPIYAPLSASLPINSLKNEYELTLLTSTQLHNNKKSDNFQKQSQMKTRQRVTIRQGQRQIENNVILNMIQQLVTQKTRRIFQANKIQKQNNVGNLNAVWWGVVDSIFMALERIINVKVNVGGKSSKNGNGEGVRQRSKKEQRYTNISYLNTNINTSTKSNMNMSNNTNNSINNSHNNSHNNSSNNNNNNSTNSIQQQNIECTIQLCKLYSNLQLQNNCNYELITKYFQDFTHLSIILESIFYQKVIIYLLGSIQKWRNQNEIILLYNLGIDILPVVISCRKLIIEILMQQVENQVYDSLVRKPKYIAREKKLIQISKFINFVRVDFQKCLKNLASPNKYGIFQIPAFKGIKEINKLEERWRNVVFDVPMSPYASVLDNGKYNLVIEPVNILYRHNKKQESLQVDFNAENFLEMLSDHFNIVLFTVFEKQLSLLNYLGTLENSKILQILDRRYLRYNEGRLHKNIQKINANMSPANTLILDSKVNLGYYKNCLYPLLLIDGNRGEERVIKINGRLIKSNNHDEDYLKNLGKKILQAARNGGKWEMILDKKIE